MFMKKITFLIFICFLLSACSQNPNEPMADGNSILMPEKNGYYVYNGFMINLYALNNSKSNFDVKAYIMNEGTVVSAEPIKTNVLSVKTFIDGQEKTVNLTLSGYKYKNKTWYNDTEADGIVYKPFAVDANNIILQNQSNKFACLINLQSGEQKDIFGTPDFQNFTPPDEDPLYSCWWSGIDGLSEDGRYVIFTSNRNYYYGSSQNAWSLSIYDMQTGKTSEISKNVSVHFDDFSDQNIIIFRTYDDAESNLFDIKSYDILTGETKLLLNSAKLGSAAFNCSKNFALTFSINGLTSIMDLTTKKLLETNVQAETASSKRLKITSDKRYALFIRTPPSSSSLLDEIPVIVDLKTGKKYEVDCTLFGLANINYAMWIDNEKLILNGLGSINNEMVSRIIDIRFGVI